jgi:hypothetical protein
MCVTNTLAYELVLLGSVGDESALKVSVITLAANLSSKY